MRPTRIDPIFRDDGATSLIERHVTGDKGLTGHSGGSGERNSVNVGQNEMGGNGRRLAGTRARDYRNSNKERSFLTTQAQRTSGLMTRRSGLASI
jgi:hypothetical protein